MDSGTDVKENILKCVNDFKQFLSSPDFNLNKGPLFFKNLSVFITTLTKHTEKICSELKFSNEQNFCIVVYLTQCCSIYELYKDLYDKQIFKSKAILEIQRCLRIQLTSWLDNADVLFDNNGDPTVGTFLSLVDSALDKLDEIDVNKGKEQAQFDLSLVSSIIQEILCLSMSIAHVAFGNDNKIITAGCRSVLNAMESLKTEIDRKTINIPMCNLLTDTCNDTLCALETRVNTAVLRLCVNVFSEHKNQIEKLHDFCACSKQVDNDMLESLISKFDLHTDRIFQISLFSIASSTIGKRVVNIKNIISNLEFLEGELVPAFVAMTKDTSQYRKTFSTFLKKSWIAQVTCFRKAVHCIIEPSAYCKLVYDELKEKTEDMWQQISHRNNITRLMVDPFLFYTKELGGMLTECMDSFDTNMTNNITMQLRVVHKVLNELTATSDLLLNETSVDFNETMNKKIFKRCQVLVTAIKRLWMSTTDTSQENQCSITKVKNIPSQTFMKANSPVENTKGNDQAIESIMIKSKQILKDRSMHLLSQTINQSFKRNNLKSSVNEEKINRVKRCADLREYSFRQGTFMEDLSIRKQVLSHIDEDF